MQLDDETCFWLKDFSQKILPITSGEGGENTLEQKRCLYILTYFFLKRITTDLKN